jgi:hypothetical protein
MKSKLFLLAGSFVAITLMSCNNESKYLDLTTGNRVDLKKDSSTNLMVDAETGKPVKIYVDREKNDTIWGATGKVINGRVVKTDNGEWKYDGDDELKVKNENDDYKKKVESDGDIKIKDGDKKIKIDGKTGERKVKKDD